jgi:hypothetical protein
MPRCQIDHLTITAPTLAAGAAYVQDMLGVAPQMGGEHARMGTHNRLLRLGPAMFLEVITTNPAATAPARPRWFGLDHLPPDAAPKLAAWVVSSPDIHAALARTDTHLGCIEPMRRGHLDWLITIPADGSLALGGAAPILIEWHTSAHPAAGLPDVGLSLAKLEISHPEPERIRYLLNCLSIAGNIEVTASPPDQAASLCAHIDTPQGRRLLSTTTSPRSA